MRLPDLDLKKISSSLSGLKGVSKEGRSAQSFASGDMGPWAVPLCVVILALLASMLTTTLIAGLAVGRNIEAQKELAKIIANRSPGLFSARASSPGDGALKFDAFNVKAGAGQKAETDKALDSLKLVGTLPGIGAWIKSDSSVELVLKKQEIGGYVLELIDSGRVLLSKGGEFFPLYLNYIEPAAKQVTAPPAVTALGDKDAKTSSGITMAVLNGADGTITREMLDELLMNPYGEIAKVRLVPMEGGSGMTVLSMQGDSLLGQMGVQVGDTLTGINGVSIKDITNLSNAINSMLTGARLDFQILRDKKPGKLGYVVQ